MLPPEQMEDYQKKKKKTTMKLKWHKPNTASQMQEMNGQKMIIFTQKMFS